jgi:hypothetical protein
MRKLMLLLMASAGSLGIASALAQQSLVTINAQHQNTSPKAIIVTGFCNATAAPKDLEGWVGQTSASTLYASLSGTAREAITIVVPPSWYYKIAVVVPAGGVCSASSTTL